MEALAETFGDGAWLLILDNLEQVVQVASGLGELLARCPRVVILATSRAVLGLRAEREYPVPPLALPADPAAVPLEELESSPAVALFVDRDPDVLSRYPHHRKLRLGRRAGRARNSGR